MNGEVSLLRGWRGISNRSGWLQLFNEKSRYQAVQVRQIQRSCQGTRISTSDCEDVFVVVQFEPRRKNRCAWKPAPNLHAERKVRGCPSGSAITIDERVNEVEPPKYEGCKMDWVGIFPAPVNLVDEIFHQAGNLKVPGRNVWPDGNRTWAKQTGACVQAGDRVKV